MQLKLNIKQIENEISSYNGFDHALCGHLILMEKRNRIRSAFRHTSLSLAIQNCLFDESKCVGVAGTAAFINRTNHQHELELIKFNQNCGQKSGIVTRTEQHKLKKNHTHTKRRIW